jgi:hypothetical protein
MILDPKHLFAYAPYGVHCQVWQYIVGWKNRKLSFDSGHDFYNKLEDGLVRLFLRPFSDLTKEIEVNGEKFIPIDILKQEFLIDYFVFGEYKFGWTGFIDPIGNNHFPIYMKNEIMDECSYLFYQKLVEWHFDIFGLIDAGLAVDINTVKF